MNKKTCAGLTALAALGLTAATSTAFAQSAITSSNPFSLGDLVVSQVGVTGSTTALSSAATADVLDEFTTGGSLVGSLALPTAAGNGNNPFTNSGTATSEGALSLSSNGTELLLGGYDAGVGTISIASTPATADPREVAVVTANGSVNDSTTLGNSFSGNDIRGVTSTGSTTIYAGGATSPGLVSTTQGSTANGTAVETTSANIRNVDEDTVAGSTNLYFSTGSTPVSPATGTKGIFEVTNPSTDGAATQIASDVSAIATGTGASGSPYGFYFTPDGTTLYVADSGGSILKYTNTGGTVPYAFDNAIATGLSGVTGLTGVTTTAGVTSLYGVDPMNLFSLTDIDTATGETDTASILATAGTNTAFRGIAFAPQALTSGSPAPEPSQVGMLALMGLGLGGLMLRARRRTVAA